MDKYVIAPPSGSTNNSVGAADRPWKEGVFEKLVADDVIAKGPVVDVRAFGAKGDGVTDDTEAFRQALLAAKGAMLLVTKGNYYLTQNLFADDVTEVKDFGLYPHIKPVYPYKGKKIPQLNQFEVVGRVHLEMQDTSYPLLSESMMFNRSNGKLIIGVIEKAGGTGWDRPGRIVEVDKSTFAITKEKTLPYNAHIVSIGSAFDSNRVIVDGRFLDATTYDYIEDCPIYTETSSWTGVDYDPICHLYVVLSSGDFAINGGVLSFRLYDDNYNYLRTVTVKSDFIPLPGPTGDTSGLNGWCVHDGIFMDVGFSMVGEASLLGGTFYTQQCDGIEYEGITVDTNGDIYVNCNLDDNYSYIYKYNKNTTPDKNNATLADSSVIVNDANIFPNLNNIVKKSIRFIDNTNNNQTNLPVGIRQAEKGFLATFPARTSNTWSKYIKQMFIDADTNEIYARQLSWVDPYSGIPWHLVSAHGSVRAMWADIINVTPPSGSENFDFTPTRDGIAMLEGTPRVGETFALSDGGVVINKIYGSNGTTSVALFLPVKKNTKVTVLAHGTLTVLRYVPYMYNKNGAY